MERDYKKEYQNRLKSKTKLNCMIPNDIALKFKEKLKKDGKTYTQWHLEEIEKYLKKN